MMADDTTACRSQRLVLLLVREVAPDRGGEGALPKIVDGMGKAFPPLSAPGAAVQIAVRARVRGSRREAGEGLLSLS